MKKICSPIAAAFLFAAAAPSQGLDVTVPIGFVNAVGLPSKTDFKIDGQSLKPAGFVEGGYASSFGLKPGNRQFALTNSNCEQVTKSIEIKQGSSPLYVLYRIANRQRDGSIKNVLKLTELPQQTTPRGPRFFVFSTLEGRLTTIQVNGSVASIEPLKLTPVTGETLSVQSEGIKPLRVSPRESGNYVLVLFEGSDSHVRWSFVEMTR